MISASEKNIAGKDRVSVCVCWGKIICIFRKGSHLKEVIFE